MNLRRRSYRKELLDSEDIPFEDIKQNMEELDVINTWLGGHSITIKGLKKLLGDRKQITVCEIGCGGGDNLAAIVRWCNSRNIKVHCIGIDVKDECIAFARRHDLLKVNTTWITDDYRNASFISKPDIIFSSLFCHHFSDEELTHQIKWMKENTGLGFFINDLQRNIIAYHAIRLLTKLLSASYLVKNDAPLSVARGLVRKEWEIILENACIGHFQLRWQWAFRYLILYTHG